MTPYLSSHSLFVYLGNNPTFVHPNSVRLPCLFTPYMRQLICHRRCFNSPFKKCTCIGPNLFGTRQFNLPPLYGPGYFSNIILSISCCPKGDPVNCDYLIP